MIAASGLPARRLDRALAETTKVTRNLERSGRTHEDADDVVGTIDCDDAIGFDPLPLLREFDQQGVRVVVIGQVAGILHGSLELTGDLDFLWSGVPSEVNGMIEAFSRVEAALFDDDAEPVGGGPAAFALPKVTFRSVKASGDCCSPALPWGSMDVRAFMDRAESCDIDGSRVHYLTKEDLITMRLAAGRPKDLRRAAELKDLLD